MLNGPSNAPGRNCVINIKTQHDCVELSMVASFHHDKVKTKRNLFRASHYEKVRGKYFTFPSHLKNFITLENFDAIEKHTNTRIFIYHLTNNKFKNKNNYEIRIVRRGKNQNVSEDRYIYLCIITDSNHVCCIKDIQQFIKVIRHQNNQGHSKFPTKHCLYCLTQVKLETFPTHIEMCSDYTGTQNVYMPHKGSQMSFNAHYALEQAPYVCYYDCETILKPEHDHENIINCHELAAYGYVIINKNKQVCKFRVETGVNLQVDLITSMIDDFTELMSAFQKEWNITPCLTKAEELEHAKASECMICGIKFSDKVLSNRHHSWDRQVELNLDGSVKVSNYIGALCTYCNLKITLKRDYMPTFAHNASNFDIKFIIDGASSDIFEEPVLCAKSAERYIQVKVKEKKKEDEGRFQKRYGVCFQDSFCFLNSGLGKLAKSLKDSGHTFPILSAQMRDLGYSNETISLCQMKGIFPYSYITDQYKIKGNMST